jgi:site-specific DNA-methyltransferase (adenine-specific)
MLEKNKVYNGDCLALMGDLDDLSVDMIFTDPPYALGSKVIIKSDGKPDYSKAVDFMGRWDMPDGKFWETWFKQAFKVMKHGAYCLVFGLDRQLLPFKYYATLAGFEEQESLYWFFCSNFPKAVNLGKGIDRLAGVERKVIGFQKFSEWSSTGVMNSGSCGLTKTEVPITEPVTDLAKKYDKYKYGVAALKQTNETILVFKKPYKTGSCLHDVMAMENGDKTITCGALNIEGNRVGDETFIAVSDERTSKGKYGDRVWATPERVGTFPTQTFIDGEAKDILEKQRGGNTKGVQVCDYGRGDFDIYHYCPKTATSERNEDNNDHVTVKPLALIVKILSLFKTPNKQLILDPFAGSGTTGVACKHLYQDYILMEKDPKYYEIAVNRVEKQSILDMFGEPVESETKEPVESENLLDLLS